ncbi:putative protein, unknown function [Plasmodium reichenowi]|uniref:WD and tetratricopeptide repeats protein 1 n=1 Tax=Plasmodium reichenowi TaxID=5854 RepID=A0A151L502_PLARE|nr:putative protein, unknown function [Plasmodium reichenowi]KYN93937.1 putative protein, unknown function [Plasmodium reichenowi]
MKYNSHQNDNIYNDIIKLKYNKNYSNYIHQNVQSNKFFISRLKNTMTLDGHASFVNRLKWNDDNHLLASCGSDRKVLIWNINSYNYKPKPKYIVNTNHVSSIFGVSFIDNDFVITGAMDKQVHVYNIHDASYKVIHNCHLKTVRHIATIPKENKNIFWSSSDDGTVRQYDTREKHICVSPNCRNVIINLNRIGDQYYSQKNPEERLYYRMKFQSHYTKNTYELIRAMNEQKFCNVNVPIQARCIAVNPIFNNYIGVCSNDMLSRVYDRRMLGKFSLNEKMTLRSCIPSDTYYPKHLWNYIDEESDFRINYHLFYSTDLGWSNDGKYLGVTYNTEHVYLYDFLNREEERSLNYNLIDNDTKFDYNKSFDILFPPHDIKDGYMYWDNIKNDRNRMKEYFDYINDMSLIQDIEKSAILAYDNKEYYKAEYLYNNCLNLSRNKNIRKILYCNLAMVLIQRKARNDGYLAEQYALEALKLDPNYYKAVYRRIQANIINNRLINAYRITLSACSHFKGVFEFIYLRKKIRRTLYHIYKDKIYSYWRNQNNDTEDSKQPYYYSTIKKQTSKVQQKDEKERIQDNCSEFLDISDNTAYSYDSIRTDDSDFTDDPYGSDYLDCSDKTRKMSTLGEKEIKQREKNLNMESKHVESVNMDSVNVESVNMDSVNVESVNMDSVNVENENMDSLNVERINEESVNLINDKRRYNNPQNSGHVNIENDRSETTYKEIKEDNDLGKKKEENNKYNENYKINKKNIEKNDTCNNNNYDNVLMISEMKKIKEKEKKERELKKALSLKRRKKYTNIIDIIASEELYSLPNSYPFFLIYYVSFCYRNSINAWNGWPSFNDLYKTYNICEKILKEKKRKDKKGKNNKSIKRINCNYEYIFKHKEAENISYFNKKDKKNILKNNYSNKFMKNNMLKDSSKRKKIRKSSQSDIYEEYKKIKKNQKNFHLNNSDDHNIEHISGHRDETYILDNTNIYDDDNNNNNNNTNDITKYNKKGKNKISHTQKNTNTNTHIQFNENKEEEIKTSNNILKFNKRNKDIYEDVKSDEPKERYAWLEEKCFIGKKKRKHGKKQNTMDIKRNAYLKKKRKRKNLTDDDNYNDGDKDNDNNNDNNDNNDNNNNNNNNQNNYYLHYGFLSALYNRTHSHDNDKERDRKENLKNEISYILEELSKKNSPKNLVRINIYHEAYHTVTMNQLYGYNESSFHLNNVSLNVSVNNERNSVTNEETYENNGNYEYADTSIYNESNVDIMNSWDNMNYSENFVRTNVSDNTLSIGHYSNTDVTNITDNVNSNNDNNNDDNNDNNSDDNNDDNSDNNNDDNNDNNNDDNNDNNNDDNNDNNNNNDQNNDNNQNVEENKIIGKVESVSQELYNNYKIDDIQLGNYIDTLLVGNNYKINNNMLASCYGTSIRSNNTSNLGINMNQIIPYDDNSIIVGSPITKNYYLYINNFYDFVYNYNKNNIIRKNINHSNNNNNNNNNNMYKLQKNTTSYHNSSSYYSDISDWNNNQIPKNKLHKKGYKYYSNDCEVCSKKYNKVKEEKENKRKKKKVKKEEERKFSDTEKKNISDKEKQWNDVKKKMSSYYKNEYDMRYYEKYRTGKKKKQQNKDCSYKKDKTNSDGDNSSNDKIGDDVNHNIMGFFEKSSGRNEDILNIKKKKKEKKKKDSNKKSDPLEYSKMNIENYNLKRNIKKKEEESHDMSGIYKRYFDKSTNNNSQHKEYIIHDSDNLVYKINVEDIDKNNMNKIIASNEKYLLNNGEIANFKFDPYSNNIETDESDSSNLSKVSYKSSSSYEHQFYDSFYNNIQYEDRKKHSNIYVFKERKKIKNYVEKIQDPLWVPKGTCKRFLGHSNTAWEMKELAFWNDDVILAASDNGEVYFWSIKDGKLLNVIKSHARHVNCVQVHPRGTCLATSGLENYIKIWKPHDTAEFVFVIKNEQHIYIKMNTLDKSVEQRLSENQKHIESSYMDYYNFINFSPVLQKANDYMNYFDSISDNSVQ